MTPVADDLMVKLRSFVLQVIPDIEVIQGLGNGVAMPDGPFVCFTATKQRRISTNISRHMPTENLRNVLMPTEYTLQVDCYGPLSSDYATLLAALWRDSYACDSLAPLAAPLNVTNPVQIPLVNGEQNYEHRWTFSALLQFNPVIAVPQQYADVIEVDVKPPADWGALVIQPPVDGTF